jgi:hypothetical protein
MFGHHAVTPNIHLPSVVGRSAWGGWLDFLKPWPSMHPERRPYDAAVADAKREHQSRVDKAKADLKDLPVISTDKNVVLAGVAAIMPWVPEAWVNGIVAAFWVLLFTFGPPTLLKFGLQSAAPRTAPQSPRGGRS